MFLILIYIFPKSISELSYDEINVIAKCFRTKVNMKAKFVLCVSLRKSEYNRLYDLKKTALIENAIINAGYIPGPDNSLCYQAREYCGIKKYEKDYNYPDKVKKLLKKLGERCSIQNNCPKSVQCMESMSRYPILKTGEICYKVMTFERRKVA